MKAFACWWTFRLFSVFHNYAKCLTLYVKDTYVSLALWTVILWGEITELETICIFHFSNYYQIALQKVVFQLILHPTVSDMLISVKAVDISILVNWQSLGLGNGLVGIWLFIHCSLFYPYKALFCFCNTHTNTILQ